MAIWGTPGERPRTWLKPAYKHIKNKLGGNLTGAAIGISFGYGEEYVLENVSLKKLFMIDPYTHYDFSAMTPELWEEQYNHAKEKFGGLQNADLWRVSSEAASRLIADGSLDFVYIDGNHFYPAVKKDIELWWPKVRVGGVMGGHDYSDVPPETKVDDLLYTFAIDGVHYGVIKAVREFASSDGLKLNHEMIGLESECDWWIDK